MMTYLNRLGQQLLTRILLSVISIFIALLLLEAGVRWLPPPYAASGSGILPQVDIFQCDADLGWSGRPNLQTTLALTNVYQTDLSLNNSGFHDRTHLPQKTAQNVRIVMLGDSFVQAVQVAEHETAHQVLEDLLQQSGMSEAEVISGGVGGWGTTQALLTYQQRWQHFQPDLVLLMLYLGNDFDDNLPGRVITIGGRNCYAPYFLLCDQQLFGPFAFAPGVSRRQNRCDVLSRHMVKTAGQLYQTSQLYQQLEPLFSRSHRQEQLGTTIPGPYWSLYVPNDDPEVEQAWQLTEALLTRFNQTVQANHSRFAVAFFPSDLFIEFMALDPHAQAALLVENPQFKQVEIDRPNRRLATFLQEQAIPFIDLTEPLVQARRSGTIINLPIDAHWTVAGNRLVAESLASWLAQEKLLSE